MREFNIDGHSAGQRLDKFMARVMCAAPHSEIYRSLRKKKVRVNGKHTDGAYRLCSGDVVCIYVNDEFFGASDVSFPWENAQTDIVIAYEDENILIADKPHGLPSQETAPGADCLESRIRAYLLSNGKLNLNAVPLFIPSLCHRIDRNTAGLVIAAKNSAALRILNQKLKNREIRKLYLCETERTPAPPCGKICGWLRRGADRKMIFSETESDGASRCETKYKTLKNGSPALVEAELLTGRTHQIRAGLAHIGCPIAGDVKYGAKPDGTHRYQHLTAYKLIFDFKSDSGILEYLNNKIIEI